MRKDFLLLVRNIPKVKDYQIGIQLKAAITLWTNRFDELFFKQYLNKAFKYDQTLNESDRNYYDRKLRKLGWDFYIELGQMPLNRADDYWSPEARFVSPTLT